MPSIVNILCHDIVGYQMHNLICMTTPSNCQFCDPKAIADKIFHKTRNFYCIYNHKPVLPGHSLVIPKRHTESILDLSDKELREISKLMREMSAILMEAYGGTGVDLTIQDGVVAGASVAHTHMHVVPRRAGDITGDPSLWFTKIIEAEKSRTTLSNKEMKENVKKIKLVIKKRKFAERQKKADKSRTATHDKAGSTKTENVENPSTVAG